MVLIDWVFLILAWVIIGIFFYRLYQKKIEKPKLWKSIVVVFIGLFSFSINLPFKESILNIAILPLGIFLLYLVIGRNHQGERWLRYRSFAWLGFFGNYVFLAFALVTPYIGDLIYPKDSLSTYISSIKDAQVITIHPSASSNSINETSLQEQIKSASEQEIVSEEWYAEAHESLEIKGRKEKFPYQLVGVEPKVGSGLHTMIYIEQDGKGLLVSTQKRQVYFRTEQPILMWEEGDGNED
ncbi:hypothetical protein [Bacillus suaedaesalsae]|uniref:Uncharacterized protein n=1 Tax=Bacillus suaedaesalsae TaxID=2810349 RepID=A0ABS2DH98_9BACI|nr:hypothetical protein [Bacillus suaedaesalsae]MBM6617400.1 hypothetical protein [Bacillus suaedaesalsae]